MVGFAKFIDLEYVEISSSAYINMLNNFKINISSMLHLFFMQNLFVYGKYWTVKFYMGQISNFRNRVTINKEQIQHA